MKALAENTNSSLRGRIKLFWDQYIRNWSRNFSQMRFQLILPFAFLTAVTASFGIYVVSNFFSNNIQERFSNHLLETSRVAADEMVRQEREHLDELRLLVFTEGVSKAIANDNAESLEKLLFPIVLNEEIQLLTVVDKSGTEVLSLIHDSETDNYTRSTGVILSSLEMVQNAIQGVSDDLGDKHISILELSGLQYFATAAPVRDFQGEEIGAIIIASQLSSLAGDLKELSLAEIIILDANGKLLETTLAKPDEGFQAIELKSIDVNDFKNSYSENLLLYGREFRATYSPLVARSENLGFLGVVLPMNYVITTSFNSRLLLSAMFSLSTIGVIIVGSILASRLIKPIMKLRNVTMQVASGDLYKKTDLRRNDEIGQLASVFDLMTARLRRRNREAKKLYSDLKLRAGEISEANTKLQNSQQQLIQSEKLSSIGQLVAGLVHDIKTPLGVIMFASEELQQSLPGNANSDEYFRILNSSADKANTIISDLLKFARQSEPEKSVQNMIETLNVAVRLTEHERKKNSVELEKLNWPTTLTCNYDSRQIEGVLINLFTNAIYAMPQGGTLSIAIEQQDSIILTISDTGTGIHPDLQNKIFDPFFTTKPEGEGTGLGLSVAYGIISDHGGQIEMQSQIGKGTTFTIRLPSSPAEYKNGSNSRPKSKSKQTNGHSPEPIAIPEAGNKNSSNGRPKSKSKRTNGHSPEPMAIPELEIDANLDLVEKIN